jgi:hypothetical protein
MQKFQMYLLERPYPEILLLPGDAAADVYAVGRADRPWKRPSHPPLLKPLTHLNSTFEFACARPLRPPPILLL